MKTTVELTTTDIDNAIREYLKHKHSLIADKITFNVRDMADDRFGGHSYELASASVVLVNKE